LGHRDKRGLELDVIRGWRGSKGAPVQLDPTLDEIAALSRANQRATVVIDQYAAEPIRQALRRRGVTVTERPCAARSAEPTPRRRQAGSTASVTSGTSSAMKP
jgi:hypothetical protein